MNNKTVTGLELKWETLIVYLAPVVGFIFAFIKKDGIDEDARFHYKQAGAAFIVYAACSVVISVLTTLSTTLAFSALGVLTLGFELVDLLLGVIDILVLVFSIITIVRAFNGQKYAIPFINNLGNAIWK